MKIPHSTPLFSSLPHYFVLPQHVSDFYPVLPSPSLQTSASFLIVNSCLLYFTHVTHSAAVFSSTFIVFRFLLLCFWIAFRKSAVGTSNDTHTHTHTDSCSGEEGMCSKLTLFRLRSGSSTHTQAHVLCVHAWLFCHGCAFCVEWLPVWACCKGSRAKPFSFTLPWSVCWLYHCSCSALCSLATIQFRQIPTGIWLKFLLNSQLNKQRQTVCPQSCLDRCQCAVGCPDMNLKSRFKKNKKINNFNSINICLLCRVFARFIQSFFLYASMFALVITKMNRPSRLFPKFVDFIFTLHNYKQTWACKQSPMESQVAH